MAEASKSKRDQAAKVLSNLLATTPYQHRDTIPLLVDLIVDAAKEEIRAELAEQAEERRWQEMKAAVSEASMPHWLSREFCEEWRALRAKREAAGKSTD
jgi:hypothetical protein